MVQLKLYWELKLPTKILILSVFMFREKAVIVRVTFVMHRAITLKTSSIARIAWKDGHEQLPSLNLSLLHFPRLDFLDFLD